MEFRTKAEAKKRIDELERKEALNLHRGSPVCDARAAEYRAEAARIRALLPGLGE